MVYSSTTRSFDNSLSQTPQSLDCPVHLTISGDLGSGKSTVARIISHELGATIMSTGDIHRSIARSLNLSALGANHFAEMDPSIDTQIDSTTRRVANEATEPIVFDSRMAWRFVEQAFRVRLVVDPEVGASRAFSRDSTDVEAYSSLSQANIEIRERCESEIKRFIDTYGVDISDPRHYHLVVDTSDASPDEVSREILHRLRSGNYNQQELLLSPRRIVPDCDQTDSRQCLHEVVVRYERPYFYLVSGGQQLESAIDDGATLILACLVSNESK